MAYILHSVAVHTLNHPAINHSINIISITDVVAVVVHAKCAATSLLFCGVETTKTPAELINYSWLLIGLRCDRDVVRIDCGTDGWTNDVPMHYELHLHSLHFAGAARLGVA